MSRTRPEPHASGVPSFSDRTVDLLRRAAQRLQNLDFDDEVGMFAAVRAAVTSLAPVDAFYVGLYRGDRGLVLPYTYYRGRLLRPDFTHFRDDGLSAWILRHRTTYRYSQDQGSIISRGMPLGDASKPTLDAVVVPLRHGGADPIGMVSVQSETADVYRQEHVAAFEWLTATLARYLTRNHELAFDFDVFASYPALDPASEDPSLRTMHAVSRRMAQVVASAQAVVRAAGTDPAVADEAGRHLALCERQQSELALLLGHLADRTDTTRSDQWNQLTSRQQQVAELLARTGASNREIAARLDIRESTVKSHVRRILRVFDVPDRNAFRSLPNLME